MHMVIIKPVFSHSFPKIISHFTLLLYYCVIVPHRNCIQLSFCILPAWTHTVIWLPLFTKIFCVVQTVFCIRAAHSLYLYLWKPFLPRTKHFSMFLLGWEEEETCTVPGNGCMLNSHLTHPQSSSPFQVLLAILWWQWPSLLLSLKGRNNWASCGQGCRA